MAEQDVTQDVTEQLRLEIKLLRRKMLREQQLRVRRKLLSPVVRDFELGYKLLELERRLRELER